jgi:hypothetical protein
MYAGSKVYCAEVKKLHECYYLSRFGRMKTTIEMMLLKQSLENICSFPDTVNELDTTQTRHATALGAASTKKRRICNFEFDLVLSSLLYLRRAGLPHLATSPSLMALIMHEGLPLAV